MIMEVYILPKIHENTVWQGPLSGQHRQSHAIPETTKWSGNTLFSTMGSCGSAHTIHHLDIQIPTINGPKDVWPTLWGPCLHDVAKYTCCCNSCSCSWTCHKIWKGVSTHTLADIMKNTCHCLGRSKNWHVIYSMNEIYAIHLWSLLLTCSMMTRANGWCALNHQGSWSIPPRIQSFTLTRPLRLYRIA